MMITSSLQSGNPGNVSIINFIILIAIGSIHFIWFGVEIITMLTNEKRRALHDFIARSVVVKI